MEMRNNNRKISRTLLFFVVLLSNIYTCTPQQKDEVKKALKYWREADAFLRREKPDSLAAETAYRKALHYQPRRSEIQYGLSNLLYARGKYAEAVSYYRDALKNTSGEQLKASIYHNLGNSYMKMQDYGKAVEAYKNSLRLEPGNEQTRYNLALAMRELQKQNKQNGGKNRKDKNEQKQQSGDTDNGQNKQQSDPQNQKQKDQQKQNNPQDKKDKQGENREQNKGDDRKDKGQDEKSGNGKEQQNDGKEQNNEKGREKDQSEENREGEKPQQEEQQAGNRSGNTKKEKENTGRDEGKISPARMQRLLEAMENEEKKTLKKIRFKKGKGKHRKTDKDW